MHVIFIPENTGDDPCIFSFTSEKAFHDELNGSTNDYILPPWKEYIVIPSGEVSERIIDKAFWKKIPKPKTTRSALVFKTHSDAHEDELREIVIRDIDRIPVDSFVDAETRTGSITEYRLSCAVSILHAYMRERALWQIDDPVASFDGDEEILNDELKKDLKRIINVMMTGYRSGLRDAKKAGYCKGAKEPNPTNALLDLISEKL